MVNGPESKTFNDGGMLSDTVTEKCLDANSARSQFGGFCRLTFTPFTSRESMAVKTTM